MKILEINKKILDIKSYIVKFHHILQIGKTGEIYFALLIKNKKNRYDIRYYGFQLYWFTGFEIRLEFYRGYKRMTLSNTQKKHTFSISTQEVY